MSDPYGYEFGGHDEVEIAKQEPVQTDAPTCRNCGTLMQPAGKCYACPCCGDSSGCS